MKGKIVKIVILAAILVVTGLSMSCGGDSLPNPSSTYTPTPTTDEPTPLPTVVADNFPIPYGGIGISPAKVWVGNPNPFYPGARAEWPITIHSGNSQTATFSVTYSYPNSVYKEYSYPTVEVEDWVFITDPSPVIAPYETKDILIILDMPYSAEAPGDKWEFRIKVAEVDQAGTVTIDVECRWLITMR